eukprot:TRINITY_DN23736_c0_g1_i1.p3 TRINITY_DN23736_c0_g1~~TRINITY_DN23736_c0_g1_i1.p3  ORF type:complete len:116 (-),score=27.01 TRINITY_DN23736_c0_g1_i1:47-394(-)
MPQTNQLLDKLVKEVSKLPPNSEIGQMLMPSPYQTSPKITLPSAQSQFLSNSAINLNSMAPQKGSPQSPKSPKEASSFIEKPGYKKLSESVNFSCLLYTSPSPRDRQKSRMPSSA